MTVMEGCTRHCRRILVIEDERSLRVPLVDYLQARHARVVGAQDGETGLKLADEQQFDIALVDVRLPGMDGISVLRKLRERGPETQVVLMTAYGSVESAVQAMKMGAFDYVAKPFRFEEIDAVIGRLCQFRHLSEQVEDLTSEVACAGAFAGMLGRSERMQQVLRLVRSVAAGEAGVLIRGETGTGKELVAAALHELSNRRARRLVKINCAAIPDTLIESEMFGHERGSFTGAISRKIGRFEAADGGTIFLDEIAELSPAGQAKLLRVLQEGEFDRVGGHEPIRVDVRVIAATQRDLKAMGREGLFREDLYYRIAVIEIPLPPLRERPVDVADLALHFMKRFANKARKDVREFAPGVLDALSQYLFPGNVRELENIIERAVTLASGPVLESGVFPEDVVGRASAAALLPRPDGGEMQPLAEAVSRFERAYCEEALRRAGDRRAEAARLLGISRKTLWEKLRETSAPPEDGE